MEGDKPLNKRFRMGNALGSGYFDNVESRKRPALHPDEARLDLAQRDLFRENPHGI